MWAIAYKGQWSGSLADLSVKPLRLSCRPVGRNPPLTSPTHPGIKGEQGLAPAVDICTIRYAYATRMRFRSRLPSDSLPIGSSVGEDESGVVPEGEDGLITPRQKM